MTSAAPRDRPIAEEIRQVLPQTAVRCGPLDVSIVLAQQVLEPSSTQKEQP